MAMKSWQQFEREIRELARLKWGAEPQQKEIAGVKFDCVLEISWAHWVIIEITENHDLDKVRGDVNRIAAARTRAFSDNIFVEGFIVMRDLPTQAMLKVGEELKVKVLTEAVLQRLFFDFRLYSQMRRTLQFGSAVDPVTGRPDTATYVPVLYKRHRAESITIKELAGFLESGAPVVLTGEYGAGKSRCVKEIFDAITSTDEMPFILSVDLRRSWGLNTGAEIIRRHLEEIGMADSADNLIRAFNSGKVTFLLDGFDEIGGQSWSKDPTDIKQVRYSTLKGVRDIVQKSKHGVLICGREHYFNSNEEMLDALGLALARTEIIRCEDQFTEEEMEVFMENAGIDLILPDWLPRRPLMCQALATVDPEHRKLMFGHANADVEFWRTFMDIVCDREAKIRDVLKKETIYDVLRSLSRATRSKIENLGPVTFKEIQQAFEDAVGQPPSDESLVILQRLPGLGRVSADTDERKFIDIFILDGLRAVDVVRAVHDDDRAVIQEGWFNPLEELGQKILGADILLEDNIGKYRAFVRHSTSGKNKIIGGDVIAATVRGTPAADFRGAIVQETIISRLDMENCAVRNARIEDSVLSELVLPKAAPTDFTLINCQIGKIYGITSAGAMPSWMPDCEISQYESAANVSRIKLIHLSDKHRILVTILKKLFLQKGAGRQEDALLRGLGQLDRGGYLDGILKILKGAGFVKIVPGDHGNLYIPERRHTDRVKKMIAELGSSQDQVWKEVESL